ncbi:MAG: GWxTD domain-containing protein [Ignavibacteria bacterium]|nr:GWxTD domain-containing protein [Ignavibacteria bacterium]
MISRRILNIVTSIGLGGIAVISAMFGCGGSSQLDIMDTRGDSGYEPGIPNFDMEAIPRWHEDDPGIDLSVSILKASLIFVRAENGYSASVMTEVQVYDQETEDLVAEEVWTDTMVATTYAQTQLFETRLTTRRIPVAPGKYIIQVTLRDTNSDKKARRRRQIKVLDLTSDTIMLSQIQIESWRKGSPPAPAMKFHIPSTFDSLRCFLTLHNASGAQKTSVEIVLQRFLHDTSVAVPPYAFSPMIGTLDYRGISYDRVDTIQVRSQTIETLDQETPIEFFFSSLGKGLYFIHVTVHITGISPGGDEGGLNGSRGFAIMGHSFPRLTTLDDLIEPLVYIVREGELDSIRVAKTGIDKRRRFDSFWLSLAENKQSATNLIKQYYNRIEEANLYFTGYKEGWKTDRGMIYVVLGPPISIQYGIDFEVWHYSNVDQDQLTTYVFKRITLVEGNLPFDNYVLDRRSYYDQGWLNAIARWRRGVTF